MTYYAIVFKAIVLWMMSLKPCYTDTETYTERQERIEIIAEAVINAAEWGTTVCRDGSGATIFEKDCKPIWPGKQEELIAHLVNIGAWESAFSERVHKGECNIKKGECDGGLAKGIWQVHADHHQFKSIYYVQEQEWMEMDGADAVHTLNAAVGAVKKLSASARMCGKNMAAQVYTAYATGKCTAKFNLAYDRSRSYKYILQRINSDLSEQMN